MSRRVAVLLSRGLTGAVILVLTGALMYGVLGVTRHALEPLPIIGQGLDGIVLWTRILIAVLWCGWARALWRRTPNRYLRRKAYFFSGVFTVLALFAVRAAVLAANAMLDPFAKVATSIHVRSRYQKVYRYKTGGTYEVEYATVNRLDHPAESIKIEWETCRVQGSQVASPWATLMIGRGLFGVPWISYPVLCRPLEVGDRPLFGDVVLGKARPMALLVINSFETTSSDGLYRRTRESLVAMLEEIAAGRADLPGVDAQQALTDAILLLNKDERRELERILGPVQDGSAADGAAAARAALAFVRPLLAREDWELHARTWVQALGRAAPDVPVVIAWTGSRPDLLPDCRANPRCRSVPKAEIDGDILALFTGQAEPWRPDAVYLADAKGRRVSRALLYDTAQIPAFTQRLKTLDGPAGNP